jgi:hypothetical protein
MVDFTAYTWWMATYDSNTVECCVVVDHEGMPTLGDIYENCGEQITFDYKEQPPCFTPPRKGACEGDYLYLVDTRSRNARSGRCPRRVWLSLDGCDAVSRAHEHL